MLPLQAIRLDVHNSHVSSLIFADVSKGHIVLTNVRGQHFLRLLQWPVTQLIIVEGSAGVTASEINARDVYMAPTIPEAFEIAKAVRLKKQKLVVLSVPGTMFAQRIFDSYTPRGWKDRVQSKIIRQYFQRHMRSRGLVQRHVATSLGISDTRFSMILSGKEHPLPELRQRLAEFFEIPVKTVHQMFEKSHLTKEIL